MLNPGSKFVRVNDVIVSLEKLELLPEDLGTNEAAIEKRVPSEVAAGDYSVINHDRITAGWHNAVEVAAAGWGQKGRTWLRNWRARPRLSREAPEALGAPRQYCLRAKERQ